MFRPNSRLDARVTTRNTAANRGALFNSDSLMNGSATMLKVISRTDQVAGNIVPIYGSIKTGAVRKKNEERKGTRPRTMYRLFQARFPPRSVTPLRLQCYLVIRINKYFYSTFIFILQSCQTIWKLQRCSTALTIQC